MAVNNKAYKYTFGSVRLGYHTSIWETLRPAKWLLDSRAGFECFITPARCERITCRVINVLLKEFMKAHTHTQPLC